jgi:hypothetical protein
MPVTAKLSRRFYERFGDELTNELVEWFNAVDATYQTELRALNELNFARFEAKMGERFAESDAKSERRFAELDVGLERRFAAIDARFAATDARFAAIDVRFAGIDDRFTTLEERLVARFSAFEARLFRWFVGMLSTTLFAVVGVVVAVALRR